MLIDSASLETATRTRCWSRSLIKDASFAGGPAPLLSGINETPEMDKSRADPLKTTEGSGSAGRMNFDSHVDLHGITLPAAGLAGWVIGPGLRADFEQFQDPEFHLRKFLADLNQPPSGNRNHFGAGGSFDDALRNANLGEWEDIPKDMVLPEQPAGPLLKPLFVEPRLVAQSADSRTLLIPLRARTRDAFPALRCCGWFFRKEIDRS